jgi:hypothetical protein
MKVAAVTHADVANLHRSITAKHPTAGKSDDRLLANHAF